MRQSNLGSSNGLDYNDSTPPDDGVQLPLTPPATDERLTRKGDTSDVGKAMQMFRAFWDQSSLDQLAPVTELRVSPPQYQELLRRLGEEQALAQYVDDKVRFDYDPTKSLLTTRMPSPVHEFFTNLLANEIRDQLKEISERTDKVGHFAGQIEYGGSSRILLREGISDEGLGTTDHVVRREPDGQFQHPDAAYPGVALEVSYSQDGKNLKKLACDYILRSNGDIRAVIGVNINDGKESTVSLWRPNYVKEEDEELEILEVRQDISYRPFRSSDGSPIDSQDSLQLSLSDFATDEISSGYESTSLSIPFRRLADLLTQAEEMREAREAESGPRGIRSKRRTIKRKLSSSSADELRSEDEAKYRRQESDVAERSAADDGEYGSGRRRKK